MKKFLNFAILMIVIILLEACGINEDKNSSMEHLEEDNNSNYIQGSELFSDKLCNSIIEIDYYSFDEKITKVNDIEKIREIWKTLKDQNYQKLEEDKFVEGLYMMDFVTENTAYSFCFTGDIIGFKDGQYKVTNIKDDFDLTEYIFGILNIER